MLNLDEIYTGFLWEPANQNYCDDDPDAFPLALVCCYDKKMQMYLEHYHAHHLFVHQHS
jgi:hypothetical protein